MKTQTCHLQDATPFLYCQDWSEELQKHNLDAVSDKMRHAGIGKNSAQMEVF